MPVPTGTPPRRAALDRATTAAAPLLRLLPGTGLATLMAMAATFVSSVHGGPQFLYALFFGVAFHYLSEEQKTGPGIEFCARTLLRVGVGLLGARITVDQIAGLGWWTALVVVIGVTTTIGIALLVGRWLGLTRAQSTLSGGAVAICGASAALAIAAVIPRDKQDDRFTLMVVVSVTVLSTAAMVLYPLLAKVMNLPPELAGLFLGGTIHDVAQVVGAGYTLSHETGDIATVVKLFRVALLTVVVVAVAAAFHRTTKDKPVELQGAAKARRIPLVPWFLWVFVAMVAMNSSRLLPEDIISRVNDFSRGCLVVAIAALGMKTSFKQLARAGWRPLALILTETIWLAAVVLVLIALRPG